MVLHNAPLIDGCRQQYSHILSGHSQNSAIRVKHRVYYGGACSPFVWPTRENYSRDHVRRFPTIVHNSGKNGHPVGILS